MAGLEDSRESLTNNSGILTTLSSLGTYFRKFNSKGKQAIDKKLVRYINSNIKSNTMIMMLLCLNPFDYREFNKVIEFVKNVKEIKRDPIKQNKFNYLKPEDDTDETI